MAYENVDPHNLWGPFKAKVDLSGKQFTFVKFGEANELEVCGEGEAGYALYDAPEAGQHGTLVLGAEVTKVKIKGTVKVDDPLCSDGTGEGIVATAASGHYILARALEAGVSGNIITVLTAVPVAKA